MRLPVLPVLLASGGEVMV